MVHLRRLIFFCLLASVAVASDFQEYKKQQKSEYSLYKNNLENEYKAYKNAQVQAFNEFKRELIKYWKNPVVSTQHTWVEYSKDLKKRKRVDFKTSTITLEVIAQNEKEAHQQMRGMVKEVGYKSIDEAYKGDILEQKINKILNKRTSELRSSKKVVGDCLEKDYIKKAVLAVSNKKLKKHTYNKQTIYVISLKLPSNALLKKAKIYKSKIIMAAKKEKISPELLYAIIHSESSFNPMAHSFVPAFGLMQIVPKTAGVDAYYYLYKKKRLLSSSYLYQIDNNIDIGSAYLHILYYRYLRGIKNPLSRLYCTIAAYNTGSGNVAKSFVGSRNIKAAYKKINTMSADEVYETLLQKLPYEETKHYLKKVSSKMRFYRNFLS